MVCLCPKECRGTRVNHNDTKDKPNDVLFLQMCRPEPGKPLHITSSGMLCD